MAVELNRVIGVSNSDYPSTIKEFLIGSVFFSGLLGFLWNHSKSPEKKRPSIEKSLLNSAKLCKDFVTEDKKMAAISRFMKP